MHLLNLPYVHTFHKEKWFPRAWRLCEFSMHFLNLPYAHTFHKKNDSLVFFLNVCVQITFLTCLVFTLITREPWIFMNASYMVSYLNLLVCLISTFIAAIWPFFGVYHDMFFKIPCVIAGKVTKVTFVWFLIHMHLHVPKEHWSALSNISTGIASQSPRQFCWM